jgi:hypothetical protein
VGQTCRRRQKCSWRAYPGAYLGLGSCRARLRRP